MSVFLFGEVCKIFAAGSLSKAADTEAFLTSVVLRFRGWDSREACQERREENPDLCAIQRSRNADV